ncbi:MAG: DUF488 domain-containing protein [Anaerolineae bacterium]|nr:DUF488 domain-containing protein [Anaerolineae bacterium]
MADSLRVWTIGHSDRSLPELIQLLRAHSISLVVDVRSQPYSQWAPQFNREALARGLEAADIAYRYLGDELGGRVAEGRADLELWLRLGEAKVTAMERCALWATNRSDARTDAAIPIPRPLRVPPVNRDMGRPPHDFWELRGKDSGLAVEARLILWGAHSHGVATRLAM